MTRAPLILLPLTLLLGCPGDPAGAQATGASGATKVAIQCNWLPEPQFGGIYHAAQAGIFAKHGIDADVRKGGPDIPAVQMAAAGQVEFALAAADEVIRIREGGADVVAVFATYQTAPQGLMTHGERGVATLEELLRAEGTLAVQPGLAYVKYLERTVGIQAKLVPYQGGLGQYMASRERLDFAQQCFVTSEPLAAEREGAPARVFLVADSGFNPYTSVVITRRDYLEQHPETVKGVVAALREGWRGYLDDPSAANAHMHALNGSMDLETFSAAAAAQESLIDTGAPLGSMTLARWEELQRQLVEIEAVEGSGKPADCFVSLE